MVVPYSTINLWFYMGLLYYRLGEVGLALFLLQAKLLTGNAQALIKLSVHSLLYGKGFSPEKKPCVVVV